MVNFGDIRSALIYFLKEKSAAIFPSDELIGWDAKTFRDHMTHKKVKLSVFSEDEEETLKVLLLQVSTQSWDDVQDGQEHELVDTRTFVFEMKQLKIHMEEIRPHIEPLRPKSRQKFPSKKVINKNSNARLVRFEQTTTG